MRFTETGKWSITYQNFLLFSSREIGVSILIWLLMGRSFSVAICLDRIQSITFTRKIQRPLQSINHHYSQQDSRVAKPLPPPSLGPTFIGRWGCSSVNHSAYKLIGTESRPTGYTGKFSVGNSLRQLIQLY